MLAYRPKRQHRYPRLSVGAKLVIVGDSITQMNHFATSAKVSSRGAGYVQWAIMDIPSIQHLVWYDAGAGTKLFRGANFGEDGFTATQIFGTMASAIAAGANLIIHLGGTNVGSTDALASTTIASIQSSIDAAKTAGIPIIVCTVWPREVAASPTGSQISAASMQRIRNINNWIRKQEAPDVIICDPWLDLLDFDNALYGNPKSGYLYDPVHPAANGAYLMSRRLNKILKAMIPHDFFNDTYFNADPNDAGNRFLDGELAGTGGTARYGMTGSVATNWIAECLNGGTNITGVASLIANSRTGGQIQRMVFTSDGLGGATDQEKCIYQPAGFRVDEPSMTNGKYQAMYVPLTVHNPDGALGSIYLSNRNSTQANFGYAKEFRNGTNANEPWPVGSWREWLISQPIDYATSDVFIPQLVIEMLGGVAGTVTVDVECAILRETEDPDVTFPYTP